MKLLIDECLHLSLVERAHAAGHAADHVNYLGLGSYKDWELMDIVIERDYTFVTNNRSDFLALHSRRQLHAGLIVIVPNVTPDRQQRLFDAALKHIGQRELINAVSKWNTTALRLIAQNIRCLRERSNIWVSH